MHKNIYNKTAYLSLILLASGLLVSCSSGAGMRKSTSPAHPLLFVHRAGHKGKIFSQNSLRAVVRTLSRLNKPKQFDGIEVDIVLTGDNVPVLAHEPWVNNKYCLKKEQGVFKKFKGFPLIRDFSVKILQSHFKCGGFPIVTLDFLLELMQRVPNVALYLDVKIDERYTQSPKNYAQAVFIALRKRPPSSRLFIEVPDKKSMDAFYAVKKEGYLPIVSLPVFKSEKKDGSRQAALLMAKTAKCLSSGTCSPLKKALEAGAKAVAAPQTIMPKEPVIQAGKKGIGSVLFLQAPSRLIQKEQLKDYCRWPLTAIIADFPEYGNCKSILEKKPSTKKGCL